MGLGPLHTVGLSEARSRASELRLQILDGIDPMQERADLKAERLARKAERIKTTTFKECAEQYYKKHHTTWTNEKHRNQWISTMRDYVFPVIGNLNVADIETRHIEKVLDPIWSKIPETASRVQKRIEHVMNYAIAGKLTKNGDNPAHREFIKARLGKLQKDVEHHAALPFLETPTFMARLRDRDSVSARALEFTILTAARTNEVIGAHWNEIDTRSAVWTIPAERMKALREHRIPLCPRALRVLERARALHNGGLIFPGRFDQPLSSASMMAALKRMNRADLTVHGFRATFRTWAAERTTFPREVAEAALAHLVGDDTERAYQRGDLFEKRRRLMAEWGEYIA